MKTKKLILAACLLGATTVAFSQASTGTPSNTDAFGKGTNVINVGVGLGGYYTNLNAGYSSSPNIIISYDNGTFGNVGPGTISLGGILSYKSFSDVYSNGNYYTWDQKWTYFIIGLRSAYHWNFTTNSHFDPYAGLMLGYYAASYSVTTNFPNASGGPPDNYPGYIGLSLYIGARYYVSDHIGFWLELGYGYTDAALGVSFKF